MDSILVLAAVLAILGTAGIVVYGYFRIELNRELALNYREELRSQRAAAKIQEQSTADSGGWGQIMQLLQDPQVQQIVQGYLSTLRPQQPQVPQLGEIDPQQHR